MGIVMGHVHSDKVAIEKALKRTLDPDIFSLCLTGRRVLVGLDKAEDMASGLIHKPRTVVDKEQSEMGSGWIIAVGPQVGEPDSMPPGGLMCSSPEEALGLHIYFQMWAGKTFRTDDADGEWAGKDSLVIMTDRDVMAWDLLTDI